MIDFSVGTSRFGPGVSHPRFRARNFAVRAVGKQPGTRLTGELVMWLFNGNLNVAPPGPWPRWQAGMKEQGW